MNQLEFQRNHLQIYQTTEILGLFTFESELYVSSLFERDVLTSK